MNQGQLYVLNCLHYSSFRVPPAIDKHQGYHFDTFAILVGLTGRKLRKGMIWQPDLGRIQKPHVRAFCSIRCGCRLYARTDVRQSEPSL